MDAISITIISSGNTATHFLDNVNDSIKVVQKACRPGLFRLRWKRPCVYSVQRLSKNEKWNDVARIVINV